MWRGFGGSVLGNECDAQGGARLGGVQQLPAMFEAILLELPFDDGSKAIGQVTQFLHGMINL